MFAQQITQTHTPQGGEGTSYGIQKSQSFVFDDAMDSLTHYN